MLTLQYGMNSKVDENWLAARYPYLRAVVIEGAEAIEHHGWKWWKHQQQDLSQLQMELIDIWHFMLSEMLLDCEGDIEQAAGSLMDAVESHTADSLVFDGQSYRIGDLDLIGKLELLIGTSVSRRIEIGLFAAIMRDCQMDWDDLFRQYVGKNVLNFFRQDNGYKQGSYRKNWSGREDNEHLVEILAELNARDDHFQEQLYQALEIRYQVID
ncbi:MAG: dUTP diphosphatase [Pseudomonadales bacterium]|nr:dUTP diphosphatase [Pseudomonadales bacterium]